MEVIFYSNFKKRVNSTKRPSGGTSIQCLMKQPTDTHEPVLRLTGIAPGSYNYFKLGEHYFYISSEIVFPNNYIEIHGSLDSMATCADDIKATTAFVERSENGTTTIIDSLAPAMTDCKASLLGSIGLQDLSTTGSYVLTISNMPGVLVLDFGSFIGLYNRLNSEDVINQLKDSIVDLSSIINGAIWLPFSNLTTTASLPIKAGFVDTGISGNLLASEFKRQIAGFVIPISEISTDSSAYVSLEVFLPFVGTVQLSPDDFKDGVLNVDMSIDNHTGAIMYRIMNGTGNIISTCGGSCGVPIPIGSTSYNVGGAFASTVGMIAGIATGNLLGTFSAGALAFNGLRSSTSTGGGSGSRAGLAYTNIELSMIRKGIPESLTNKINIIGLPTYKTLKLGSLNGYVQCIGASIQSTHDMNAVAECNNYLNSGAWIE